MITEDDKGNKSFRGIPILIKGPNFHCPKCDLNIAPANVKCPKCGQEWLTGEQRYSDIPVEMSKNEILDDLKFVESGEERLPTKVRTDLPPLAWKKLLHGDTDDSINHPKHYTSHPSGIECIQITRHMNFNLGNAIKYIWRASEKNGVEDLKKAVWYIQDEIRKHD